MAQIFSQIKTKSKITRNSNIIFQKKPSVHSEGKVAGGLRQLVGYSLHCLCISANWSASAFA
jgi:hypothetical protein